MLKPTAYIACLGARRGMLRTPIHIIVHSEITPGSYSPPARRRLIDFCGALP